MERIKVSAISYLNTIPYVYGLLHSEVIGSIELSYDYPAECARRLIAGEAHVGIVPVATLPHIPNGKIVSDFCIGAEGAVRTVVLLSNTPMQDIRRVFLDYQSRTSVNLARVLCKHFWGIMPQWEPLSPQMDVGGFANSDGVVLIGDRVFEAENRYAYRYDLASEWLKFTGLPFVFAVWAANRNLSDDFLSKFNAALQHGISSIPLAVGELYGGGAVSHDEAEYYLAHNISFNLTKKKREAISLFLRYVSDIEGDKFNSGITT